MRIREYEQGDRDGVAALMDDFGDELAVMDPHGRVIRAPGMGERAVDTMEARAARNGGSVVVAEDGGRIIGFASGEVHRRDPDEELEVIDYVNGQVSELYVVPGHRRGGIGRRLMAALDEHFRAAGCTAVHVEVFAPNREARAFYAHLGFEERDLSLFRPLAHHGSRSETSALLIGVGNSSTPHSRWMDLDAMLFLVRYHARSNEQILETSAKLTAEELRRPGPLGHGSAFETLLHLHLTDWSWRDFCVTEDEEDDSYPDGWPPSDLAGLHEFGSQEDSRLIDWSRWADWLLTSHSRG